VIDAISKNSDALFIEKLNFLIHDFLSDVTADRIFSFYHEIVTRFDEIMKFWRREPSLGFMPHQFVMRDRGNAGMAAANNWASRSS
jgi:hypothetical protein